MKDYILPFSYISILLNPLMRSGNLVTLSLTLPMLNDIEACEITLNRETPEIHNVVKHKTYMREFNDISKKTKKDYLLNELPEYNRFQDAFFYSGVIKPSGLDPLFKYIHDAASQSVIRGGDVYYIALDTNVLMDRIYSNYLRAYSDAPNMDFILTDTVRSEMTNRKDKINPKMVKDLTYLFGEVSSNFRNQNVLADRQRYIGFLEYNRIRHETDCDQLTPERRMNDKDEEIIKAYADFAVEGHNRKILLISRDNEFIRMSPSLPDVIPIIIEHSFPKTLSHPIKCTYPALFSFIYHLSIIFSQVNIRLKGHQLYRCLGVWPQKNVDQWENDHAKIMAKEELPYLETIDHHTAILLKMNYKKESQRFPRR